MRPSPDLLDLAKEIIHDTWKKKKSEYLNQLTDIDRQKKETDIKIQGLMSRLVETEDPTLVRLYEDHIKNLEHKRMNFSEQSKTMMSVNTTFDDAVGTAFDFISNPRSMWVNGDFEDKLLVLKLAFAQKVPYHPKTGFGIIAMSLPFRVLSDIDTQKSKMVVEVVAG